MNNNRKIWDHPWKYKEGLIVSLSLLLLGFLLEFISGGRGVTHIVAYPANLYFGFGLLISIVIISTTSSKSPLTLWLQSIPAALSSIGLLLFISLLMGLTLQHDNAAPEFIRKLGLSHVLTSWPYLLANLFILLSLGLTTVKNLITFRWSKLGFVVSHLGLWIVLFGANFGSLQVQRLEMSLNEGSMSNTATDKYTNTQYTMPFFIGLEDFILDEYNPKLALVNNHSGMLYTNESNSTISIDSLVTDNIDNWQITIKEYIYSSSKAGDNYYHVNEIGAAPSALIQAKDDKGNIVEGWISCGSFNRPYESLKLSNNYSAVMLFPEPKKFTSVIEILEKDKKPKKVHLQVNKPVKIGEWKIYQMSYDAKLGRWSETSVIELIRDPWLKVVYAGIFLMLAGALYMFWMGSGIRDNKNK